MKYVYYLCLSGAVAIGLSSCQTVYNYRLGAGMHAYDLIYQPKPLASRDSGVHSASYLGGVIVFGKGYQEKSAIFGSASRSQQRDSHQLGLLQFSRAHSWNAATVSYGTFGYLGKYYISSHTFNEYTKDSLGNVNPNSEPIPSIYAGSYAFYGFGLRGSAQLTAIIGRNTNWRFLGIEMVYSREYGELYKIRQIIPDKKVSNGINRPTNAHNGYDNWYISRDPYLFTAALTSEMVFNADPVRDRSFTLKYSMGISSNTYDTTPWFTIINFVVAYQYRQHAISLTIGNAQYKTATHLSYHYRMGYTQKKKRASSN